MSPSGNLRTGAYAVSRSARSGAPRRVDWQPAAAVLPGVLLLLGFFGIPLVSLARTSLSSWSGIGPMEFVGFENFASIFGSTDFYDSMRLSTVMALGSAAGIIIIATVLAALVSAQVRGGRFYRVVWFLPAIAPSAAVAVFWALAVQPTSGVVNVMLGALGLGDMHAWLNEPNSALAVVVFVTVWHSVGFAFLIILGAMEDVPVSVYEAASIDGCGPIRRFFQMTLPLIRPVLTMITLLELIWAFNGFTVVWGLTRGGPGDATTIMPVLVYKEAFQFANFGTAAAISIIGGALLLIIGMISQKIGNAKDDAR